MVEIIGDVKPIKEAMKQRRGEMQKLERRNKNVYESSRYRVLIRQYSVSLTLPVKTPEGIIINGKVLQQFLKKLKKMYYEIHSSTKSLVVYYGNSPSDWSGKLHLYDISEYFKGFENIPELAVSK